MCCRIGAAAGPGLVHQHTALGSRPAPGTPSAKRSVGTRLAASMQDTLSEGAARAAQLAPSAITAPAQSEDLPPEVWCRLSPTTSGSSTPRGFPHNGWRVGDRCCRTGGVVAQRSNSKPKSTKVLERFRRLLESPRRSRTRSTSKTPQQNTIRVQPSPHGTLARFFPSPPVTSQSSFQTHPDPPSPPALFSGAPFAS